MCNVIKVNHFGGKSLKEYYNVEDPDIVINMGKTSDEYGVLIINTYHAIHTCSSKYDFHNRCTSSIRLKDAGKIYYQKFCMLDIKDDTRNTRDNTIHIKGLTFNVPSMVYPAIIKRNKGSGGKGSYILKNFNDLICLIIDNKLGKGEYIIEEFVDKVAEYRVHIFTGLMYEEDEDESMISRKVKVGTDIKIDYTYNGINKDITFKSGVFYIQEKVNSENPDEVPEIFNRKRNKNYKMVKPQPSIKNDKYIKILYEVFETCADDIKRALSYYDIGLVCLDVGITKHGKVVIFEGNTAPAVGEYTKKAYEVLFNELKNLDICAL